MSIARKPRQRTARRPAEHPGDLHDYASIPLSRHSAPQCGVASERLERVLGYPWPYAGRPTKDDLSTWIVTDDWPEHVPVTIAEVDVFEAWFGDIFDYLFGPCQ